MTQPEAGELTTSNWLQFYLSPATATHLSCEVVNPHRKLVSPKSEILKFGRVQQQGVRNRTLWRKMGLMRKETSQPWYQGCGQCGERECMGEADYSTKKLMDNDPPQRSLLSAGDTSQMST